MGRLIDANDVKKMISDTFEKEKDVINSFWKMGTLTDKVDEIQTAYDVDAVVEQLEERTAFLKDCTKYGNKTADQQSKSYDTMMMYEVMDLVDDLLEIVKAGVSDGN